MHTKIYTKLMASAAVVAILFGASSNLHAQPCTPVPAILAGCTNGSAVMRINSFVTTGGILNVNNPNNTCSGYTYYTGTNNTVRQNAGSSISFTMNLSSPGTSFPYKVVIWVDWNHDNVFDNSPYSSSNKTGELMYQTNTSYTANSLPFAGQPACNFIVPDNAKNGVARMRIRVGTGSGVTAIPPLSPNPCTAGDFYYGEVEDYDFDVLNPCLPPTPVTFSGITHKTATINWTGKGNALFYEYLVTPTAGIPGSGNYYTTATQLVLPDGTTPIACNTKYYVYIRSVCDTGNGGLPTAAWDYSAWSSSSFTTDECCYTPEAGISYITSTTAIATWTPVPSVVKYEYAVVADPYIAIPSFGTITTATSVKLLGLSPAKAYRLFVRALCSPTPSSDWKEVPFLTQPTTGINAVASSGELELAAYPNPVKDNFTLHMNTAVVSGNAYITLSDVTGKQVWQSADVKDNMQIDLAGKASGVYLLKYYDNARVSTLKIVKE